MADTSCNISSLQVDLITKNGTITEIPYTVLPLETRGCPPPPFLPPHSRTKPGPRSHQGVMTLLKQGRKEPIGAAPKQETLPRASPPHRKETPPPLPKLGASASNHTHWIPPLISTCDVMAEVAASLSSAPNGILSCSSSPSPHCYHINCTTGSGETVLVSFMPCETPPSFHLTTSFNGFTFTNMSVAESSVQDIGLYNISFPLNFTVVQHTDFITMGIKVRL